MAEKKQPENRPADVAAADSLGGMAKRLANPGHIAGLLRRSADTVRAEGWEQLWRDVTFRVGLALHHDGWQHRADLPTRRKLKMQRATPLCGGPCISVIVPLYNTPLPYLKQMLESVTGQTYPDWDLVLVDASDAEHPEVGAAARALADKDKRILYLNVENKGIAANTTAGFLAAKGNYFALLDHDDLLYKNALYEVVQEILAHKADLVYSDEIILSGNLKQLGGYHFKPDFAPDNLRGCNYITHLAVFSRALLQQAGFEERSEFDGAQDHDLMLRLTEKAGVIRHIPRVLYIWRGHAASTAAGMEAKPYAVQAGVRAINAQLERLGLPGYAEALPDAPGAFKLHFELTGTPLVSIMIPNKDHAQDLTRCINSVYKKAGYERFEILIIENNSTEPETFACYEKLRAEHENIRVVTYYGTFNYSAINNFGRKYAKGTQLLLLNNDIELLSDGFVRELLSYSQRPDVGCVGAKLFYPDDTIQHGGVIMGINGSAGHSHKSYPRNAVGDLYRLVTAQDYMAVTGACLMVKAELYDRCGGLDEEKFAVAYNDVDLCVKLWQQGLLNVYTPEAQAYHYESKSRGSDEDGANARRYQKEKANFYEKYHRYIDDGDPYYNPHFNNKFENFGLR